MESGGWEKRSTDRGGKSRRWRTEGDDKYQGQVAASPPMHSPPPLYFPPSSRRRLLPPPCTSHSHMFPHLPAPVSPTDRVSGGGGVAVAAAAKRAAGFQKARMRSTTTAPPGKSVRGDILVYLIASVRRRSRLNCVGRSPMNSLFANGAAGGRKRLHGCSFHPLLFTVIAA